MMGMVQMIKISKFRIKKDFIFERQFYSISAYAYVP